MLGCLLLLVLPGCVCYYLECVCVRIRESNEYKHTHTQRHQTAGTLPEQKRVRVLGENRIELHHKMRERKFNEKSSGNHIKNKPFFLLLLLLGEDI